MKTIFSLELCKFKGGKWKLEIWVTNDEQVYTGVFYSFPISRIFSSERFFVPETKFIEKMAKLGTW